MPRNSRQRGDKHGPFGAAARRKVATGRFARRPGTAAAARGSRPIDIDEFMVRRGPTDLWGQHVLNIDCAAEGLQRGVL